MNMHDGWTGDPKHAQTIFWQVGNVQFVHDLFSEDTSPTITHGNQTTYQTIANAHNNNIRWAKQSYHDLAKI